MKILIELGTQQELNNFDAELRGQKAKDLSKVYTSLFTSRYGKIILEDLAEISGMHRSNFVIDNDRHAAFLEGQRALFLHICSLIENNTVNMEGSN